MGAPGGLPPNLFQIRVKLTANTNYHKRNMTVTYGKICKNNILLKDNSSVQRHKSEDELGVRKDKELTRVQCVLCPQKTQECLRWTVWGSDARRFKCVFIKKFNQRKVRTPDVLFPGWCDLTVSTLTLSDTFHSIPKHHQYPLFSNTRESFLLVQLPHCGYVTSLSGA